MKNKGTDYSKVLIWAAGLVLVVRYAAAFVASDAGELGEQWNAAMEFFMLISGIGMGLLDVVGGTYLFTGWQKKMPSNGAAWSFKFKVLSFFAIGIIVNGILILIPFTISRVAKMPMFAVLGGEVYNPLLIAWATVVNIAPYLLVGGVAVGNTIVTVTQGEQTANGSPNVRQENEQETNEARTFASLTSSHKFCFTTA
jgi:hypothetical protein